MATKKAPAKSAKLPWLKAAAKKKADSETKEAKPMKKSKKGKMC